MAASRGSAGLCTWRITVMPGLESQPHTLDTDEVFMVTAGTLRFTPHTADGTAMDTPPWAC